MRLAATAEERGSAAWLTFRSMKSVSRTRFGRLPRFARVCEEEGLTPSPSCARDGASWNGGLCRRMAARRRSSRGSTLVPF